MFSVMQGEKKDRKKGRVGLHTVTISSLSTFRITSSSRVSSKK